MVMGRPIGSTNRVTKDLKNTILKTFKAIGGDKAYADWAKANPDEFYNQWIKLLPKQIDAEVSGVLQITAIERIIVKAK